MSEIPLQTLGLEEKWPKLKKLQLEVADLDRRRRDAATELQMRQAQLKAARAEDIDAAAIALREGKQPQETSREDKARELLDAARRQEEVLARAHDAAQAELGHFREQHRQALLGDILKARQTIAFRVADNARKALADFGKWHELRYLLKDLQPPVEPTEYGSQTPSDSVHFIGQFNTRNAAEPDRGVVENQLQYLISLATEEEGGEDAA